MTSTASAVTQADVPPAGTWVIDPGHTEVAFVGRHFGLTKIRGRFTGVTGEARIANPLEQSRVTAEIDMTSVSSGDAGRDDHLRSEDFFDVDHYPTASFVSDTVDVRGNRAQLVGHLTIRDHTNPVTLDVEFLGHTVDPWDNERIVITASATIDREAWGLTWNMVLEAGGLLVSKEIRLEIDAELVLE